MDSSTPPVRTRAALHHAVRLPKQHAPGPRPQPGFVSRMMTAVARLVGLAPPPSINIVLSTVSAASSFDAYLYASFAGGAANAKTSLLLDSGNTVLIVPRWEDIEAISNWQQTYTVLGESHEPWGCPAKIVQGPIQIETDTGTPFVLEGCVFYACTDAAPDTGERTANFGAGCISPWTSSGWNTPLPTLTMKAPLAYVVAYPFAEFDYATADEVFSAGNPQGVSEKSTLRLYSTAPKGYTFLQLLPNTEWMALRPMGLRIADTKTGWPAAGNDAIAMVDSGGTCVYLSDPTGLVYATVWPSPVTNPGWTTGSTKCVSTKSSVQITLGDDAGQTFSYAINENALPVSAQGLTLVMCEENVYMRGRYGMNIGGLSALATKIMVDYESAQVGFQA